MGLKELYCKIEIVIEHSLSIQNSAAVAHSTSLKFMSTSCVLAFVER